MEENVITPADWLHAFRNASRTQKEWLDAFDKMYVTTADGHKIVNGMAVWDYNLRPGLVDLRYLGDDGWFHVKANADDQFGTLMNAERIRVRHPYTYQSALARLEEDQN